MAVVHVPPSEATEVARGLLETADYLGLPASVVKTSSDGVFGFSFLVPDEVEHLWLHGPAEPKPAEAEELTPQPEETEEPEANEDPGAEESKPEEAPAPKKRGRPKKAAAEPGEQE